MKSQPAQTARKLDACMWFGRVAEVDAAAALVVIDSGTGLRTPPIRWLAGAAGDDASWRVPEVDEQALVLAPGGELSGAVALVGIYTAAPSGVSETLRRVRFADGAEVSYDSDTGAMVVVSSGDVTVEAGGDVVIEAGTIKLGGASASDGVVRMSDLQSAITDIQTQLSTHIHATSSPGAPTAPPTVPLTFAAAAASTVVKSA